eukprot:s2593_g19.t1
MPLECIQQIAGCSSVGVSAGETAVLLEANNQAGHGQKCYVERGSHDKAVSFNARKCHMLEKHRGNMWTLAACTPQATNMTAW